MNGYEFRLWFGVMSLLIFLIALPLIAQDKTPIDSAETGKPSFHGYPYVFYSPESDFSVGAAAILTFRLLQEEGTNLSSITLGGYYSVKNQYNIALNPEIYFAHNQYLVFGVVEFGRIVDKFWGVGINTDDTGNADYAKNVFRVQLTGQTEIVKRLKVGLMYEFNNTLILEKRNNGFLLNDQVTGSNGGKIAGLGISLAWDSRDDVIYPSTGGYYKFDYIEFHTAVASDFDFRRITIDLRRFFSLKTNHIIGIQAYGKIVGGDPPFYELAALGGGQLMRGYYEGRFRDKYYTALQSEYRATPWGKFGYAAFLGYGTVADDFSGFRLKDFKYSYGAGLRYAIQEEDKLNVRVDFGVGQGTTGIYFSIKEAF